MNPSHALPSSGYALLVFTTAKRGFGSTKYIARLVNASGRICNEWLLSTSRWQLKRQVALLHDDIDEMLGGRTTLPVHYVELPPTPKGGTRQRAASYALAM